MPDLRYLPLQHRSLNRPWTHETKIISGHGYGKKREPMSEVHKWKSKVEQHELDELRETIAHFDLPLYRNLEPEALCADTLHKGLDIPGNHSL